MAIRSKKHENLTDTNISKVVELLEEEKPITKREACDILNIRYNTTRLQKIIDDWRETQEFRARRRAQNKGKGATEDELRMVVQSYIDGDNISTIANSIYRSSAFVKAIIERLGVPQKLAESDYEGMRNAMLPEQCVAEEFEFNEKVWYPRHNKFALVKQELTQLYMSQRAGYACYGNITQCINYEDKYGAKCYRLWVLEPCDTSKTYFPWLDGSKTGYHCSALAYEIGSLRHLSKYL